MRPMLFIFPVLAVVTLLISYGGCGVVPKKVLPAEAQSEPLIDYVKKDSVDNAPFVELNLEEMPQIVGGMSTIQKNIRYPQDAREAAIEGTVILKFIVDKQGYPRNIKIIDGLCDSCDAEAIRLIEQTRFIPGRVTNSSNPEGIPLEMSMSLPVEFKLP